MLPPRAHPNVIIIGGGIAGTTLAYTLGTAGYKVTLLEAGKIGSSGASAVPVALLNPYRGRSGRASGYDLEGLTSMWRLVERLEAGGYVHGAHRSGVLRIATTARQAKDWRKLEGVRFLEPDEIPSVYLAPYGGFLVEAGGWLEPPIFLRALMAAAQDAGVEVVEDCPVTRLEPGRVHTLVTARGRLEADCVVVCTGAERLEGVTLPTFERVAGEVISLHDVTPLPYPVAGGIYGAQTGERVAIGGNHRPVAQEDPSAPAQLQRAATYFVPSLKEAPLLSVFTGVRARTEAGLPLTVPLAPGLYYFGALAGRGFLAAAKASLELSEGLARQE